MLVFAPVWGAGPLAVAQLVLLLFGEGIPWYWRLLPLWLWLLSWLPLLLLVGWRMRAS